MQHKSNTRKIQMNYEILLICVFVLAQRKIYNQEKKKSIWKIKTISNIFFLYRILLLIFLLHARRALSGKHTCIQTR